MHTIISNKIYVHDASQEIWDWAVSNLVVTNPTYETLKKIGKEDTIRWKHISPKLNLFVERGFDLIIPFGCLKSIWPMIQKGTYETKFNDNGIVMNRNEKITLPLYNYQEEAVAKMLEAKSGILIGGCGSGKTQCGIEIAHRLGKRTLWLTHTTDLLKQSMNRAKMLYPDLEVGTITDGKVNIGRDITFATVQTMAKLDSDIYKDAFDVVITDECHHISGAPTLMKQFLSVIEKIPARYKFGLTASETRNDSLTKSMYCATSVNDSGRFEPTWKIDKSKIKTLIAERKEIELDTKFSYEMLNEDGTFNYSGLVEYISSNPERNAAICNIAKGYEIEGRKILILCNKISQCELLHKNLLELGSKAVLLVGKVSDKKRDEILNKKIDWNIIIATNSLAKEGLDIKELSVLIIAGIIANKSDTVQAVGRIERVCDDKPNPIVIDFIDKHIPYLISRSKKRKMWMQRRY